MSTCSSYSEFKHTSPTDNDLNLTYGNGNPGLLPLQPENDRENGMLTNSTIKTIISNLKKSGVIPTLTSDTQLFIQKQNSLIANIKSEYCFYYSRYVYSLQKLLKAVSEQNTNINKYLDSTQALNKKMNDLIQIINGVNEELLLSNTNMKNGIKTFDKEIKQMHTKLISQNKIISSSEAVAKLNKEMVKYTEEKRRYTDNLLNMYSVLNIVALSLLVYVYKSAGE